MFDVRMILWTASCALLGAGLAGAEESGGAEAAPRILGRLADGSPPPKLAEPATPAREIDFQIRTSLERQLGGRRVTLQQVEDPGLPEPPARRVPEPPDLDDPKVRAWLERQRAEAERELRESRLGFVSATVFDGERTLLRWWVTDDDNRMVAYEGWSEVDFNHLGGFTGFEFGGVRYDLIMGLGNYDTSVPRQRAAAERAFGWPEVPPVPADGPGFVITGGGADPAPGRTFMKGLHRLHEAERDRLVAAFEGRERARLAREAEPDPPRPRDITIRFWRREREGGVE